MNGHVAPSRAIARQLVPWAGLVIMVAAVLLGSFAVKVFDEAVEPELNRRTHLIGATVRANIQLALDSGIPLTDIAGADRYLEEVLRAFGEISFLALVAESGEIVASAKRQVEDAPNASATSGEGSSDEVRAYRLERAVIPVLDGNLRVGRIEVGVDRQFISTQFRNIFLDVAVVVIVATLMAFEILFAVVTRSFARPLEGLATLLRRLSDGRFDRVLDNSGSGTLIDRVAARFSDHVDDLHTRYVQLRSRIAARGGDLSPLNAFASQLGLRDRAPEPLRLREVGDVRLPFFLFVLAEELSKPFLPLYVQARLGSGGLIDAGVMISLPLAAYLACIALLSPFARTLVMRVGARRLFLLSLAPVACAQVGLAMSQSAWEIVAWRGLAGGAYALITIAFQDYAFAATRREHPGRAIGGFIAVLFGGTFCGTALGGVLADRLGQSNVFLVGAVITLVAGALALRLLERDDATSAPPSSRELLENLTRVFRTPRIAALVCGISIPANALAVSLLWFLVPLLAENLDVGVADTGRILMLYYLTIILLGPPIAARQARARGGALLPLVGALVSGGAVLGLAFSIEPAGLVVTVIAVGIGHALLRAPLVGRTLRVADEAFGAGAGEALLGTLQFAERVGSLLGLVGVAILASISGYASALVVTGGVALLGAMVYAVTEVTAYVGRRNSG